MMNDSNTIEGFINIIPMSKERARTFQHQGKSHTVTPRKTRLYEERLQKELWVLAKNHGWKMTEEYCRLGVNFFVKKEIHDTDNLLKAVMDAGQGILYKNDKQIILGEQKRIKSIHFTGIHFYLTIIHKNSYETFFICQEKEYNNVPYSIFNSRVLC